MANSVYEVLLTEAELRLDTEAPNGSAGAIVDFLGIVRAQEDNREIYGIEYEAHQTMAEHQLAVLAQEATERFQLERVVIRHRLGFVPVSEASVFVRVAGRHRQEAFEASQWIMNELKKKVPIWKQPQFAIKHRPDRKIGIQPPADSISRG